MNLKYDNCPNCFADLNGRNICGNCSIDINKIKKYESALEIFSVLNDRYLLGKVLGKGGFGITYLAQDITTGRSCCIKEYMPAEYSRRSSDGHTLVPSENNSKAIHIYEHGRKRFIDEARTLIMLYNNPRVVDITDFFEENNSAYFVMEYLEGVSMKKLKSQYGGKLPCDIAKTIMESVAIALIDVHEKNMLHRDISPENILITKNKEVKLIDFGAARDYIKAQNNGMSVVLKEGYAPPEQYSTNGSQGPWTDIYALAATFYTCVSGQKLLDAMFIMNGMKQPELIELNCGVDKKTSDVIAKAMNINYKDRYQNVKEFLEALGTNVNASLNVVGVDADVEYTRSGRTNVTTYYPQGNVQTPQQPQPLSQPQSVTYQQPQQVTQSRPVQQPQCTLQQHPVVEVLNSDIMTRKVRIPDNYIVKVGRSRECELVINNDTVISRVHIMIAYNNSVNKFVVTDVSANGSYVSGGFRLLKNKETYVDPGTIINLANESNSIILKVE